MLFLSRRSVEPLPVGPSEERDFSRRFSLRNTPRNRAASDGVFRRVSTLFSGRKRTHSKSPPSQSVPGHGPVGIGYIRSHPLILSARSSTSSTPSSSEIRRPSGLGRRAGSLESMQSLAVSEGYARPVGGTRAKTGFASLPNLLGGPSHFPVISVPHPTVQRARRDGSLALPDELLQAILLLLPRCDLPITALVSRRFCSATRHTLYRSLDFQHIAEPRVEKLCDVLARKAELAEQVITLTCHFCPTSKASSPDGNTTLFPSADFLHALQNMRNLKNLTLQSFISVLSHAPSLTFSLTKLTILDAKITQPQLMDVRSWLTSQSFLESLSFPNLVEFTDFGHPSQQSPGEKNPPAALLQTVNDDQFASGFLPRLTQLHASTQITTLLCSAIARRIRHLTLDVHETLYTGLRPSTVLRALQGIREMHIIFGHEVDKRTVEKFLGAAGGVLAKEDGTEALESLEIEVMWVDDGAAEVRSHRGYRDIADPPPHAQTLYGIVTSIISRFRGLQKLKLTSPYRTIDSQAPITLSVPLPPALPSPASTVSSSSSPSLLYVSNPRGTTVKKEFVACSTEKSYARTWTKQCPSLCDIQFDFSVSTSDADIELCGVWFRRKAPSFS
ncbi:hypothetical protein PAXRUDRAFT_603531 [Paxillus rubicundulus Ve08.2h10]|uniref:F-box domain-containing protein n=1 Tax=Paxillus rubicundulus Ve08.2h10 TaxID=930991 RepID=A0A0D0E484_9AGAM|nr:hypothetical protein PAXRUDRAFT_603531 [Paxillus rubicundulus Ve08.2h10]